MAPPFTFTRSMSAPVSFCQASTTLAKASFTSKRSMSSMERPLRSRIFCVAGMGPVSMVTGSAPATAKLWKRARAVSPSSLAFSALMVSSAEAPSVICELLPAVILPSSLKAGRSPASFSAVVPGRIPSSTESTWSLPSSST